MISFSIEMPKVPCIQIGYSKRVDREHDLHRLEQFLTNEYLEKITAKDLINLIDFLGEKQREYFHRITSTQESKLKSLFFYFDN